MVPDQLICLSRTCKARMIHILLLWRQEGFHRLLVPVTLEKSPWSANQTNLNMWLWENNFSLSFYFIGQCCWLHPWWSAASFLNCYGPMSGTEFASSTFQIRASKCQIFNEEFYNILVVAVACFGPFLLVQLWVFCSAVSWQNSVSFRLNSKSCLEKDNIIYMKAFRGYLDCICTLFSIYIKAKVS